MIPKPNRTPNPERTPTDVAPLPASTVEPTPGESTPAESTHAAPAVPGGETTADERERKERVLHTRVPAVLEAELKRFAQSMRVPVSNLVRTILEDAVAVADRATDRVERELRTAAERVHDERGRMQRAVARLDPLDGVYGYQPLVMAVTAPCARCTAPLHPGASAWLALSEREGPRMFVCARCVPGAAVPSM